MNQRTLKLLIFFYAFWSVSLQGMIFDNRYFPWIQKPYTTSACYNSHFHIDLFFTTARQAFFHDADEGPLPHLGGIFDQAVLAKQMIAVGYPDPLPLIYQGADSIPWRTLGKVQSEGLHIRGQFELPYAFQIGFDTCAIRMNSMLFYDLLPSELTTLDQMITPADIAALDQSRRSMLSTVGLTCGYADYIGMGDFDFYARWHHAWDYCLKMRRMEVGLRFGALLPAASERNVNSPASIPVGGDGFYGIYGALDAEFELKEDWKVGLYARVSKRFTARKPLRITLLKELNPSALYGVGTGIADITPGICGAFYPYVMFENIRDGLGASLQYTLIGHARNTFASDITFCTSVPSGVTPAVQSLVNNNPSQLMSSWIMEDISVNVFYDFGKMKSERAFQPILSLQFDIPVDFIAARRVAKTYKIALGVEFIF